MSADPKKYEFIDALRGLAVLAVLMVHWVQAYTPDQAYLARLMGHGNKGVQLFFIASAITLALSWRARSDGASAAPDFFIRRFFRIAPLFYVALGYYLWLDGMGPRWSAPDGLQWWYVPITALFVNGFHLTANNSIVFGGWSIAVEMAFYAMFPLIMARPRRPAFFVAGFVASFLLYVVARELLNRYVAPTLPADQRYLVPGYFYTSIFGQLPVFFIGLLAYTQLFRLRDMRIHPVLKHPALPLLAVLALFSVDFRYWVIPMHIAAAALFAWLAISLAACPSRLLVNRPMVFLGKISFSVYLSHYAVLRIFEALAPPDRAVNISLTVAGFSAFVVIVCALSAVLHRYVETPGIALGKSVIERRRRAVLTESAA